MEDKTQGGNMGPTGDLIKDLQVGDEVKVLKSRKLPVGEIGTVLYPPTQFTYGLGRWSTKVQVGNKVSWIVVENIEMVARG